MSAPGLSPTKAAPTRRIPSRPAGSVPPRSSFAKNLRRNLTAHGFLIGALICFALFSWYPMIREFFLAFQKTDNGEVSWVGLDNLRTVVNDPVFWQAWKNTLLFTVLALVFGFLVPFVVALVINEFRHGKGYLRLLVYLPVMLPPVASVLLFKYLYDPGYGLLNELIGFFGLPEQQWLQDPDTSMLSVVVASTWMNMGGAALIYLAALQGIPGELYEAAELDGAGVLRKIWYVTIPQTRLILSLMLLMQIISTMQVFVEPFLLTGGAGPEGSTTTVVYLIYQYAFNFNNYGAAAALGLLLLVLLAGFSAAYVKLSRAENE
ncbi:sugar ABC transporter permease [Streptomyces parvus]|uniref:carbohydrate ABC transporter permease n=1 Tax=Streptomyces TaxID=1883 RepID=UPI000B513C1F|nr:MULTISPECIES: sugar ABC transporter permease [unclassified Streptomyces]MYX01347.1 ABC transporter permease subunit [Streptomyces sp. SID8378]SNB77588.1 carbohydrate ABC transporter membrane protein 1, CUT1 family [Streptomyces sp. PgraA7]